MIFLLSNIKRFSRNCSDELTSFAENENKSFRGGNYCNCLYHATIQLVWFVENRGKWKYCWTFYKQQILKLTEFETSKFNFSVTTVWPSFSLLKVIQTSRKCASVKSMKLRIGRSSALVILQNYRPSSLTKRFAGFRAIPWVKLVGIFKHRCSVTSTLNEFHDGLNNAMRIKHSAMLGQFLFRLQSEGNGNSYYNCAVLATRSLVRLFRLSISNFLALSQRQFWRGTRYDTCYNIRSVYRVQQKLVTLIYV